MQGFQPQSAKRKDQPASSGARGFVPGQRKGYASGGMVKGPGTGISDSIPAKLSHGEYVLPADTVQAVGVDRLDALKNATHTPAAIQRENPAMNFADGGAARGFQPGYRDEPVIGTRGPMPTGSGDGGGMSRDAVASAIARPAPAPQKTGMAALTANPVTNPRGILRERERMAGMADGGIVRGFKPGYKQKEQPGGARGFKPLHLADGTPGGVDETLRQQLIAQIPTDGMPKAPADDGSKNDISNSDWGRNISNIVSALPVAGMAMPAAGFVGARLAPTIVKAAAKFGPTALPVAGLMGLEAASSSAAPTPPPVSAPKVEPEVQGAPVTAMTPATPAPPAAAPVIPTRPVAAAPVIQTPATAPDARGFTPGIVPNSSNSWQARNDLRNLEVSASSITNRQPIDRRGNPIGAEAPAVTAYKTALAADAAARGAQPTMDAAAMRENGALQRSQMQEAGASARDTNRTGLLAGELGLKQEAQGFKTRAAQQLENLRGAYAAETDPAKRDVLGRQLLTMEGKEPKADWAVQVTPAGKNADGSSTEGSVIRYNKSTGQAERVDLGGTPQILPMPKTASEAMVGKVYQTVRGPAKWDGKQFIPQ